MTASRTDVSVPTIAQLLATRAGLGASRSYEDLDQVVRETMQFVGCTDRGRFTEQLAAGEHWQALIDRVTVGETYFFRNPEHFQLVRQTILPAILAERDRYHRLRVWSAGCASGEEIYSLAILLLQLGQLHHSTLLGTDLSLRALARARAGRYREWSFRATNPESITPYFVSQGAERVIVDTLRQHVEFAQLNLAGDEYPSILGGTSHVDLIFCRNVLIYFDDVSIANVERRMFESLAPGGWLVTGPSEPLLGRRAPFEIITHSHAVCYRRPSASSVPRQESRRPSRRPAAAIGLQPLLDSARTSHEPVHVPEPFVARAEAAVALERAEYARVIELAGAHLDDAELSALAVRAIWNHVGAAAAAERCSEALKRHVLSAELQYLRAMILVDCRRLPEAIKALRQALYLDRSLVIAQFALGALLERTQEPDGARRAYRNALEACRALGPEQELILGDGVVASGLADAAAHALREIDKKWPA